ncbi:MAG: ROK family protein [Hydrogeniiclostridium mannosilyticum]
MEGLEAISAKTVAEAAHAGDATAQKVYRLCGEKLGMGLALITDIINPEIIVIGSIFERSHSLLWPAAKEVWEREALRYSQPCCRIVPACLGDSIGDYAALSVAFQPS